MSVLDLDIYMGAAQDSPPPPPPLQACWLDIPGGMSTLIWLYDWDCALPVSVRPGSGGILACLQLARLRAQRWLIGGDSRTKQENENAQTIMRTSLNARSRRPEIPALMRDPRLLACLLLDLWVVNSLTFRKCRLSQHSSSLPCPVMTPVVSWLGERIEGSHQ